MVRITIQYRMHCPVNVQQHAVITTPVGQTGISGETARQIVMHDDWCTQFFGILGTFVHFFRGWRCDVQIVTFTFARFDFGFVDGFHNKIKTLSPAHKWL